MQNLTQGVSSPLITHYPFGNYNERHPTMRVTVFDLPHVADAARARIAAAGLSDRCEAVGGDMFVAVPPGADAYVLKGVIHDWDDKEAIAILRNCRDAMSNSSRLLLIDRFSRSESILRMHRHGQSSFRILTCGSMWMGANAPRRSSGACWPRRT